MKVTVPLGEDELKEAVRWYAEREFRDRGLTAKGGDVRIEYTPGDRPGELGSVSASVMVEIE